MNIKLIYSMQWASEDRTTVKITADTDTGDREEIFTPYNNTSIIWDAVQAFPADQIAEYVPPVQPKPTNDGVTDVDFVEA